MKQTAGDSSIDKILAPVMQNVSAHGEQLFRLITAGFSFLPAVRFVAPKNEQCRHNRAHQQYS